MLSRFPLLPIEQLIRVDRNSSLYNEGDRRSVFYAQSWALAHMLLLGEPLRRQRVVSWREREAPKGVAFPGDPRQWEKTRHETARLTELGERLLGLTSWKE